MSTPKSFPDVESMARRVVPLHRSMVRAVQLAIFLFAGVSAFLLRFDFAIPAPSKRHMAYALVIWIIAKVATFHLFSLDRGWWRYTSVPDLLRLIAGNVAASTASSIAILLLAPTGFPRSI